MAFDPKRLNKLVKQGFEVVRHKIQSDKLDTDTFIVEKMALLNKVMGDEGWVAETFRPYRSQKQPKRPLSKTILNKLVYVCLSEGNDKVSVDWASAIFEANDMGREEMHPLLIKLLDELEKKRKSAQPQHQIRQITVPFQRPPRPPHFVGREPELQQVTEALQPGQIVTIWGPDGIGKSTLVAEVIWQMTETHPSPDQFPDGIVYYNFYSQPEASAALDHIVRSFGSEPKPTPESAAWRVLAEKKALLVFIGGETSDDLSVILSAAATCGVLMTSQKRNIGVSAFYIDLEPLPVEDAEQLLSDLAGDYSKDKAIRQQICELVGGLPLAITLIGHYLVATATYGDEYLLWLIEDPMAALDFGDRAKESIPRILEYTYSKLSGTARQILSMVSVLAPTNFDKDVIATALAISDSNTVRAFGELVNYNLLTRTGHRYQIGHILIYKFVQTVSTLDGQALNRIGLTFAALFDVYEKLGRDKWAAFELERPHILNLLDKNVTNQQWDTAANLVIKTLDFFMKRGNFADIAKVCKVGLQAAQATNFRQGEALMLTNLGTAYYNLGQMSIAVDYQEKALEVAHKFGIREIEFSSLIKLYDLCQSNGQQEKAYNYLKLALEAIKNIDDLRLRVDLLRSIAEVYQNAERLKEAAYFLEAIYFLAEEVNDEEMQAVIFNDLALVYMDLARIEPAMIVATRAVGLARQMGNSHLECVCLGTVGTLYYESGELKQARVYFNDALKLAKEINATYSECVSFHYLGRIHRDLGELPQAVDYLKKATTSNCHESNRYIGGHSSEYLGDLYVELGLIKPATQAYHHAIDAFEKIRPDLADDVRLKLNNLPHTS